MLPNFMFNDTEMLAFALVLLRVSTFTLSWPIFSMHNVPNQLKVLFAVGVTIVIFPVVSRSGLQAKGWTNDIAWLAAKEVLTGLCLGFMTRLFFFAVACGGNLVAMSSGLANAQMFNPTSGGQGTVIEQFYAVLATLLFLALNGHHFFLTGLAQSFDAIPLSINGTEFALMTSQFKDSGLILTSVTEAGIKIAAPVIAVVFLANIVMGIVARAVPQVNVLATSMNVNFMAALVVMLVAIPALLYEMNHQVVGFAEMLFKFMVAH